MSRPPRGPASTWWRGRIWPLVGIAAVAFVVGVVLTLLSTNWFGRATSSAASPAASVGAPANVTIVINGTPAALASTGAAAQLATPDHHVSDSVFQFLFWLLLFGVGAALMYWVFRFLQSSRDQYDELVKYFAATGIEAKPVTVSALFSPASAGGEGAKELTGGRAAAQVEVTIVGLDHAVVGQAQLYAATVSNAPPGGVALSWSVQRLGGAAQPDKVDPTTGTAVWVTPSAAGPFNLIVQVDGNGSAVPPFPIVAVEPAAAGGGPRIDLPFVGAGYGSIILALVLVFALIVLGVQKVLDGTAIAPILGAIAGYIFGVTTPASGK